MTQARNGKNTTILKQAKRTVMQRKQVIIGTRGSPLALIQTDIVKQKLLRVHPSLDILVHIIKTEGDKNLSPIPLDTVGKAWFTKEIEKALLEKSIDLAVHSLKDLPIMLTKGLIIDAVCDRNDSRDVLVTMTRNQLLNLRPKARVGTDSLRRQAQVLNLRADLMVESIRGNITTRLRKLDDGEYDALILAAAGLIRLGLTERITQYFDIEYVVPAPGQGALAVEVCQTNQTARTLARSINDPDIFAATKAERVFSMAVDGGCKNPVGAYAHTLGEEIIILGMIATPDGKHVYKQSLKGKVRYAEQLGKQLAKRMMSACYWYRPSSI